MEKLKFTPGPWEFEEMEGVAWVTGPDRNAPIICDIVERLTVQDEEGNYTPCLQDEDLANAKLIAAAPELYEALVDLMAFVVKHVDVADCQEYNRAHRVITKAVQ